MSQSTLKVHRAGAATEAKRDALQMSTFPSHHEKMQAVISKNAETAVGLCLRAVTCSMV